MSMQPVDYTPWCSTDGLADVSDVQPTCRLICTLIISNRLCPKTSYQACCNLIDLFAIVGNIDTRDTLLKIPDVRPLILDEESCYNEILYLQ